MVQQVVQEEEEEEEEEEVGEETRRTLPTTLAAWTATCAPATAVTMTSQQATPLLLTMELEGGWWTRCRP